MCPKNQPLKLLNVKIYATQSKHARNKIRKVQKSSEIDQKEGKIGGERGGGNDKWG